MLGDRDCRFCAATRLGERSGGVRGDDKAGECKTSCSGMMLLSISKNAHAALHKQELSFCALGACPTVTVAAHDASLPSMLCHAQRGSRLLRRYAPPSILLRLLHLDTGLAGSRTYVAIRL